MSKRIAFLSIMLNAAMAVMAQQLAFPGAEGFGRYATGGRNGTVYHVTNLNDSGTGSFRDAVSQPNRIVVFDVAGVIRISSRLSVKANITIAGQTAPGEGITIYGNGISFSDANNTICRYLRVREGVVGSSGTDACGISSGSNMIFDHCSFAWGRDEVFSISGQNPSNITVQNCIISQGLMGHSAGGLMQSDNHITIYRTLYIHNDTRNPKFKGRHQYVNNIVYNWKTAAYIMGGDSEGTSYANAEGNLFITGPTGKKNAFSGANSRYNIYARDNMIDDNQDGQYNPRTVEESEFGGGPTFQQQPYDYPVLPMVAAQDVYGNVLPEVGASLPYRDPLDRMLIDDVNSLGTEGDIISDEASNDIGAPTTWNLWAGEARTDSDGDGMPDWWETANGTNPSTNDAMTIQADGYTNIEHYINSITAEQSQYRLKAPMALKLASNTQDEITIRWRDMTDKEEGYIVEQMKDGAFSEIGRTAKNINHYTISGLTPLTEYTFRVKAYAGTSFSEYSNTLTAKTRAQKAEAIDPDTYAPDFTWTGNNSDAWDTNTANWKEGNYQNGAKVLFNNDAIQTTVSIPEEVTPAAVMVKGNKDFQLNGVIGGTGSVNMAGTGTLKLADNNTYSGTTVVWDGVLEVGRLSNIGAASSIGTGPNWIWNGGTVLYTGGSTSTNRETALQEATTINVQNATSTLTLTGEISGEGDLIKDGPGTLSQAIGLHSYTGNTIIRGGTYELKGKDQLGTMRLILGKAILEGGRLRVAGGDNSAEGILQGFPIEVRGDKESYFHYNRRAYIKNPFSGTGNLTLEVEYLREFYQGDWTNFFGTVTAKQVGTEGNQFYVDNATYGGMPNARLVLQGKLEMRAGSNSKTYQIGALSSDDTSTTLACCFVKKDGGNVTWRIGSLGTDETFVGQITNGIEHNSRIGLTNIVKEGEGYWRLTGAQKYRGTTQITGGTLIQNGTHSQDKDYNNTYFTPGQYTVEDGATLAGKGSTMAPVVVKNGGTLAPGDFGIGTLTIKNNVTLDNGSILLIEVDRSKQTQDKLACEGTLTTNGELHIQLTDGTFAIGDVITIMSAKTYKGCFTAISPAQPAEGLAWDLSELFTKGQISIVASTATGITTPDVIPDGNNSDINAYLPDGTPASADAKGIVIIRERRADGTIQTKKTIRK
ncbi:MAG: autotransporter-associated beta strand repeat-containing protein [Prevotella sp.]|nr:autotransporter-associated beta strand repeat-containing protein [Prevotella sp.]